MTEATLWKIDFSFHFSRWTIPENQTYVCLYLETRLKQRLSVYDSFLLRSAFKSKPIIYGNTYQLFCHDSASGFLQKWLICHNKGHFLINLCWSFLKKERLVTLTRTMQPVMYCTLLFHCMNHVPVSALISGVWCQEVRCQYSQEVSSWNELFFPAKCRITWNPAANWRLLKHMQQFSC